MLRTLILLALLAPAAAAASESDSLAFAASVAQLRHAAGEWDVTTEFLNEDGTVARAAEGTYRFDWVVSDRVLSGRSDLPDMQQTSAFMLYVSETLKIVEMVSVGADGRLWVMTGPIGSETRTTPPFKTSDGGEGRLRFTRYNVEPDAFESKMEWTSDGGKTWTQGNHQTFRRRG